MRLSLKGHFALRGLRVTLCVVEHPKEYRAPLYRDSRYISIVSIGDMDGLGLAPTRCLTRERNVGAATAHFASTPGRQHLRRVSFDGILKRPSPNYSLRYSVLCDAVLCDAVETRYISLFSIGHADGPEAGLCWTPFHSINYEHLLQLSTRAVSLPRLENCFGRNP